MTVPIPFKLASTYANIFTNFIGGEELPVNINLLFKLRPDIKLEVTKLNNVFGYNRKNRDDSWTIFVNENLDYPQQRVVFAHELYHIVCNQPLCDSRSELPLENIRPLDEHAAEQFAYELLMPELPFKKYWELYNGDIEHIAKLIYAPVDAVNSRALMLGL